MSEIDNVSKDHANLKNKRIKTILSFVIIILMLIILFFISVNIGSLKVSFKTLMRGLFIKYNPDVATIYDLRFPRIIISMLAGAAIAVSGVLFQAVLKKSTCRPRNNRYFKRCRVCGSLHNGICANTLFFYACSGMFWRNSGIYYSVCSVLERWT